MAQHEKHGKHPAPEPEDGKGEAGSVDRKPNPAPTPTDHAPPVRDEDEPRGHPTSDRFHTEQAHRKAGGRG